MRQRGFAAVIAIVIVAIAAAAAAYFGYKHFAQQTPPEPVRLGVSIHEITSLVAIAEDQKYFEQQNLTPTIKLYTSGTQGLADLEAGNQDVITVAETPIALGAFKRSDLRVIATIGFTDQEEKIVARSDLGVTQPSDLKGKTIATQLEASSPSYFLYLYLLKNGLSENDVKVTYNSPTDVASQLLSGKAAAMSMSEPVDSQTMQQLGSSGVEFTAPGLYQRSYNLVTTQEYASEHPEVIEAILRALLQAQTYAQKNPQQSIAIVSKVFGIDEQDVQTLWPTITLKVSFDQSLLTALDDEAHWAIQSGQVPATSTIPDFLSMSYLSPLEAVDPSAVTVER